MNRGTNAAPTSGQVDPYTLFGYDLNGNAISRERRDDTGLLRSYTLTWDGDNRLRSVNEGMTNRLTATYDGGGTRLSKTDSWTGSHSYSWGPDGLVYDSAGNTIYTPGLSQQVGGVDRYPLGLGEGDLWHDRLGRAAQAWVSTANTYYNDRLTDPSLGTAGVVGATLLTTGINVVGGFLQLPRMLGHLGEGTECFWDHPSWQTFPALMQDVGVVAAVASVGAAGFSAGAEGAAASATDAGSAEVATEGAECGSGTGCFAAGTPVRMADGSTKPIEAIRPGDRVQSRDPETGVVAAKRVVRTFIHTVDHTVLLTLPSGEEIETTEVHPFYVEGKGFVEAGKLGIGTSIVTRAGPTLAIEGITRRPGWVRVYNFEVEGFHTYFVGESGGGVWVHNAGLCDPEPTIDQLSEAAGKADRNSLTRAGRALQKHGNRAGSAFPLMKGSASELNAAGQDVVDDILTDPGSTVTRASKARYGGRILDIKAPSGRGVRFTGKGEFVGFLEP